ncbi:unnamed protein product [Cylicocyclus nassatus]|uniref:Uncharacterized protein n=1 Tax=Cylicocyclus nassatus TaxID=53992 RepID=A0AA36GUI6_CYLNA|nr:unnamed protein product [Cylicocyclus nassatus]
MAQWTTVAMSGWQVRMIVDPLANLFLDTRFNHLRKQMCCPSLPSVEAQTPPSPKIYGSGVEFLRKCAELNVMPISLMSTDGHYFRFRSATQNGTIPPEAKAKKNRAKVNHLRFDQRVL